MVLRVEFEQFPQTVKRLLDCEQAYIAARPGGALISAADHKSHTLILCEVELTPEQTRPQLEKQGMEIFKGSWSLDGSELELGASGSAHVAAVAYESEESKPGLWMDAFAEKPTLADVMRTMYDEFRANGEVPEHTSLEEFIRLANPNVVILSPEQIGGYIEAKIEC